jgi:hypothetical protein
VASAGSAASAAAALAIGRERDAVGRQARGDVGRHLAVADEQPAALCVEQQVGDEDRVALHIAAAQVQQPGHVVHGRDQVVAGANAGHRRPHARQLVGAAHGGLRRQVLVDGGEWQAGAVVPGGLQQVEVGAQLDALAAQARAQRVGQRQAQHLAVHGQRLAGLKGLRQPVDVLRGGARGHLLQRDAAAGELGLGLGPVAAVGEQRGAVARDDQAADRAGEARQPLPALPALGQVLGQVGVGGGNEHGMRAGRGQRVTQALDAQAGFGGAGVHGQDLF